MAILIKVVGIIITILRTLKSTVDFMAKLTKYIDDRDVLTYVYKLIKAIKKGESLPVNILHLITILRAVILVWHDITKDNDNVKLQSKEL